FAFHTDTMPASPMNPSSQISSKLRAALAAASLLVCWVSGSAALAAQSPDVCSMSCCVQEGHCCCTPHHAFVKAQRPDGHGTVATTSLSSSCPSGCTASQSISRNSFKDPGATTACSLSLVRPTVDGGVGGLGILARNVDLARDSRGPPLSSLQASQV